MRTLANHSTRDAGWSGSMMCGRLRVMRAIGVCLASVLMIGCRAALPTYPEMSAEESLGVIADRLGSVESIQSGATIAIEREGGSGVRLDGALVARAQGDMRVRAWKFSRAVFDATLTEGELWLLPMEQQTEAQGADATRMAQGLRRAYALLSPPFYEGAELDSERTTARELVVIGEIEGDALRCVIDRATLTPIRFESLGHDTDSMLRIELKGYRVVRVGGSEGGTGERIGVGIGDGTDGGTGGASEGVVWPYIWVITHPQGSATVRLNDVELNGELSARAFVPPRRAVRSP